MIEKKSEELLIWTDELVIDTEENNIDTNEKAKEFLDSIPQKQRVQDWGFYAMRNHYIITDVFCDIEESLKQNLISVDTCYKIYLWNKQANMEYWNMDDVYGVVNHL